MSRARLINATAPGTNKRWVYQIKLRHALRQSKAAMLLHTRLETVKLSKLVEAGGIEPPSASPLQAVLHT